MNLPVDDRCREEFENLKFRKTDIRYIVYNIQKEQVVRFLVDIDCGQSWRER